ncbi:protease modulator HflC [Oharaeibacter diazotrophicus]|uniref:Protein HflC n=1 Tax=Oharaeibacter diazotrophicus TaxID=1920512 RepID=A0A4R6RGZ4_9HYPH|nr:protease modulator HflC [Oharaeibacter diazotrophicus]TDP85572.1 protease FtsH subunit HflC [Oharaeibacter diazotrophicus]BBE74543.1 modulator of FtsH protease HflC [Pleomorphomonas sp. SM30]GLS75758.1 protein HflC [Oharaeibacter diazotrophicus]
MRQIALPFVLIVAAVLALIAYSATFVVTERDQAIQLRFGEIQRVITRPGIYFKVPTNVVDTVQIIDKRLQTLELDNNIVQVKDSRQYVVDAFTTYRITDPRAFRESVAGNLTFAEERLKTRLDAALKRVYGNRTFDAALSDARSEMMKEVSDLVRPEAATLGIEIVELRIRRTELPENVLDRTFDRMRSERLAEASELRAEGTQEARRITAEADRQATVLVAEANRDADILHGEGDAERNRIFADAYTLDTEFFEFYRSMQAYADALGTGTTMVLTPDTEFFRYFRDSGKSAVPPATVPTAPSVAPPAAAAPAAPAP